MSYATNLLRTIQSKAAITSLHTMHPTTLYQLPQYTARITQRQRCFRCHHSVLSESVGIKQVSMGIMWPKFRGGCKCH